MDQVLKVRKIMAVTESFEKKVRDHAYISERLEESEVLSTKTMNELSKKEKNIQEQAKLIEIKEKEISSDALSAEDKKILQMQESLRRMRGLMQRS